MRVNLKKLQPFELDIIKKDMLSAFAYVLKREYGLDLPKLSVYKSIYNYPQWLAALSVTSLKRVNDMGLVDSAALFPLNVTKQRVLGARKNRSKLFSFGFDIAHKMQTDMGINEDNVLSALDIQLAILFSSMIWVGFDAADKTEKNNKYQKLWVGFSGKFWKQQYKEGII